MNFILASKSKSRSDILIAAGIDHESVAADIDERSVEVPLLKTQATPADIAELLAATKALEVSQRHPDSLVLGADQTLSLDNTILHKSPDMDDARAKLLSLSGKTHQLNSAWALAKNGQVVHSAIDTAHMTMRTLTPQLVGRYLARCGDEVLASVGCYQIEGLGIGLFERIEGDHYTIIGLPLMPLLGKLRQLDVIE